MTEEQKMNQKFEEFNKKLEGMSLEERYNFLLSFGFLPSTELSNILFKNKIIDEETYNLYIKLNQTKEEKESDSFVSLTAADQLSSIQIVLGEIQKRISILDPKKDKIKIGQLHVMVNNLNAYINENFPVSKESKGTQRKPVTNQ